MLNLNVLASSTGNEKVYGSNATPIAMTKIVTVKRGTATVDLLGNYETMVNDALIKVYGLSNSGTMGKAYTKGVAASATEFYYEPSTGVLTLPTDTSSDAPDQFIIKFDRYAENSVKITNSSDKFPGTVKLTLKVLVIDPCHPDEVKSAYIVIPSFQVSPEVNITLNTEGTLDYTGSMQVAYCSSDKELYSIYVCDDDEEEE